MINVTRRTAILGSIAALFAPTVRLRNQIDIERLLQGFLDDEEYVIRYDHSKPYHLGGWTYATDARHMAWAELSKPDEDGSTRKIPNIEDVRRNLFKPTKWVDLQLPAIETLAVSDWSSGYDGLCPVCGNRRVSLGDNYPSPERMAQPDYDPDDNTIRDRSCEFCRGGQRDNLPSVATICGMPFSYWRLLPIAAIPGVRVSATERVEIPDRCDTPTKVLCFEADGIQGVAMGLRD